MSTLTHQPSQHRLGMLLLIILSICLLVRAEPEATNSAGYASILAPAPVPTEPPSLLLRLLSERADPSALTVYQPVGDAATAWPGEIIPPEKAVGWPHEGCRSRCEDYRGTVEKCNYKPEVSDIDSACMCKEEVQRQMFQCFECEMTLYTPTWESDKWKQWYYFVALSDRFLKQCETDNAPVNLTHYGLWRGWVKKYVSGKSTSTMETRPYFVPSAAARAATTRMGLLVPLVLLGAAVRGAFGRYW